MFADEVCSEHELVIARPEVGEAAAAVRTVGVQEVTVELGDPAHTRSST